MSWPGGSWKGSVYNENRAEVGSCGRDFILEVNWSGRGHVGVGAWSHLVDGPRSINMSGRGCVGVGGVVPHAGSILIY